MVLSWAWKVNNITETNIATLVAHEGAVFVETCHPTSHDTSPGGWGGYARSWPMVWDTPAEWRGVTCPLFPSRSTVLPANQLSRYIVGDLQFRVCPRQSYTTVVYWQFVAAIDNDQPCSATLKHTPFLTIINHSQHLHNHHLPLHRLYQQLYN